jgi:predicted transcriptional regulator
MKKHTERFTFKLDAETEKQLKAAALHDDVTMSAIIRRGIRQQYAAIHSGQEV